MNEQLKEDLRNCKRNNKFYKIRIARKKGKLMQSTIDWEIRKYQRELSVLEDKLKKNKQDLARLARDIADYHFENEGVI